MRHPKKKEKGVFSKIFFISSSLSLPPPPRTSSFLSLSLSQLTPPHPPSTPHTHQPPTKLTMLHILNTLISSLTITILIVRMVASHASQPQPSHHPSSRPSPYSSLHSSPQTPNQTQNQTEQDNFDMEVFWDVEAEAGRAAEDREGLEVWRGRGVFGGLFWEGVRGLGG